MGQICSICYKSSNELYPSARPSGDGSYLKYRDSDVFEKSIEGVLMSNIKA